jgi:hypothetical protein
MGDIETATETIVVFTIAIITVVVGVGVALVIGLAFRKVRIDVATSPWPLAMFVNPGMPDRPQGVQEEDLPRFVFRERVPSSEAVATATTSVDFGRASDVGVC